MKLSDLKLDASASNDGIWVDWIHGIKLKICRINNNEYVNFVRKEILPYKDKIQDENEDNSQLFEDLSLKSYSSCILVDWAGIEDDDGVPIKYNNEVGFEVLKGHSDLYEFVISKSNDFDNFRSGFLEKNSKN